MASLNDIETKVQNIIDILDCRSVSTITNGTENKTSDIFIGDTKLSSGDYVDYETQTITRGGISEPAPFPLPEISTYKGTNTLDSTETLGEVTIKGKIKEVI